MLRALRALYCFLGLLPLSSSPIVQVLLDVYSWIFILILTVLGYYLEIITTSGWYKTNAVSSTLALVLDLQVYIVTFVHLVRFSKNREQFRRLIDLIRTADRAVPGAVITGFFIVLVCCAFQTIYVVRRQLSMAYAYHAWCFIAIVFDIFLVVVQFCAIVRSLTHTLNELAMTLDPRFTTPEWIQQVDSKKDEIVATMLLTKNIHEEVILETTIDIFCRCVHYLFIGIHNLLKSRMDGYIFTVISMGVILRIYTMLFLMLTCSRAKQSVKDFNDKMFKVVLERNDLHEDEKLQLIVTRRSSVRFAPGGFFELGKQFMVSMVNAVAVYLVVLVQMSNLKSG